MSSNVLFFRRCHVLFRIALILDVISAASKTSSGRSLIWDRCALKPQCVAQALNRLIVDEVIGLSNEHLVSREQCPMFQDWINQRCFDGVIVTEGIKASMWLLTSKQLNPFFCGEPSVYAFSVNRLSASSWRIDGCSALDVNMR
jgi:hypothetical protein